MLLLAGAGAPPAGKPRQGALVGWMERKEIPVTKTCFCHQRRIPCEHVLSLRTAYPRRSTATDCKDMSVVPPEVQAH